MNRQIRRECVYRPSISQRSVGRTCRRGAVIVQVVVALAMVIGFAALTIDVGVMYNTRSDLQHAADAAALAGAAFYTTDTAMGIRRGAYENPLALATSEVRSRAQPISSEHTAFGQVTINLEAADVVPGWFDFDNPNAPLNTGVPPSQFNAVQVLERRTAGSQNGSLSLMFANIFGNGEANITAGAIAGFDDRFAGFTPNGPDTSLTPFVIHDDVFEWLTVNGPDDYGYDPDLDQINNFGDGIPEVQLYPYKESSDGDGVGAGNFGLLNVGVPNQGLTGVSDQILNGISSEDLEAEVGTSEVTFYDDYSSPVTYDITGNPGIKTGVEPDVEAKVGDVIGFFLYDILDDNGSNAVYRITGMRWGRVVGVVLTGNPDTRHIAIQPVTYSGTDIIIDEDAPSSGGLVGVLMLFR